MRLSLCGEIMLTSGVIGVTKSRIKSVKQKSAEMGNLRTYYPFSERGRVSLGGKGSAQRKILHGGEVRNSSEKASMARCHMANDRTKLPGRALLNCGRTTLYGGNARPFTRGERSVFGRSGINKRLGKGPWGWKGQVSGPLGD